MYSERVDELNATTQERDDLKKLYDGLRKRRHESPPPHPHNMHAHTHILLEDPQILAVMYANLFLLPAFYIISG